MAVLLCIISVSFSIYVWGWWLDAGGVIVRGWNVQGNSIIKSFLSSWTAWLTHFAINREKWSCRPRTAYMCAYWIRFRRVADAHHPQTSKKLVLSSSCKEISSNRIMTDLWSSSLQSNNIKSWVPTIAAQCTVSTCKKYPSYSCVCIRHRNKRII